jgi:hypothetical protein
MKRLFLTGISLAAFCFAPTFAAAMPTKEPAYKAGQFSLWMPRHVGWSMGFGALLSDDDIWMKQEFSNPYFLNPDRD